MTKETRNQNNGVEGQSTGNDLPVVEGISPEVMAAMRTQEPELFGEEEEPEGGEAAGKPAGEFPEGKTGEGAAGADGGSGQPKEAGNEKTAPLAALHEERARRKELQDRLDRREREFQAMARMQLEQARAIQQRPGPVQPPEPVDPLTQLVEQKLAERLKPFEEQRARTAALQENEARISRFEAEAKQKYADYDDVVAPVMNWMTEQAKKAQQGDQQAAAGLGFVLGQANPAEAAYTMGIRLKFEQMKAVQGQNVSGAPAAGAAGNNPPTPAEQKAAAEKAQAAISHPRGLDLGSGGGGGGKVLTEADLANMTSDEWAKLPADQRKKLLGGQI